MQQRLGLALAWVLAAALGASLPAYAADPLRVGSKRFTESYILGELLSQAAGPPGTAQHQPGLGNTAIVFAALKAGSIDLYADYTGTLAAEILKLPPGAGLDQIRRALAPMGLGAGIPLGFENTYALAVSDARAGSLQRLSDLAAQPGLRLGLSHEFLGRADGWPGLASRYGLPQRPLGLDHGVAYEALAAGQVDAIDIYSTDAKIRKYRLRVLADDRHYFPRYDAVVVYRLDVPQRFPQAWQALQHLAGRVSADDMIAMNAAAELDGQPFAAIARAFLDGGGAQAAHAADAQRSRLLAALFGPDTARLARRHVGLVAGAVGAATLVGVPLGMLAARRRRTGQVVLGAVSVLQTVPSLALLAMLIPLLGRIGVWPAMVALFLYALLPIVRNTATGLEQVPQGMRDAARALGLRGAQVLRYVELPLALPVLLAGVKTAAIISVGTATIAAFVGAGGFGERIATGLALNDTTLLLAGAIPAAVLALLVQAGFEALEWALRRQRDAR
ncbi:putative ABC-type glycine betaine transport system, Substrate-binding inner membrane component [Cupriavidus taiwanensis]|uniref:ABC transporter permease n=1 Tax=Cupriavidus taiwanensis TaxID=164546 RepID=A0A375CU98_9BURK|nr:putative ABC-type glycine betaine transport system, Substrate-binding inner membrane component [Cupriavidus taiwanensis]SOY92205.1 putative ABC-type glycine betaine transport system, Substrate-binding inner membrane component [Cupriavidus taiwanensis]SPD64555.1 ABC transporter permease [Cupriavidus taiwanensis]